MSYKKIVSVFSLTMLNISHVYAEDASTQAPARLRPSLSEEMTSGWPDNISVSICSACPDQPFDIFTGTYVKQPAAENTRGESVIAWKKEGGNGGKDLYLYGHKEAVFRTSSLYIADDLNDSFIYRKPITDKNNSDYFKSDGWVDGEGLPATIQLTPTSCGNSCRRRGVCASGKCSWQKSKKSNLDDFLRRDDYIRRIQRLLRGSSFVEYQSMVAIEDIVAA